MAKKKKFNSAGSFNPVQKTTSLEEEVALPAQKEETSEEGTKGNIDEVKVPEKDIKAQEVILKRTTKNAYVKDLKGVTFQFTFKEEEAKKYDLESAENIVKIHKFVEIYKG